MTPKVWNKHLRNAPSDAVYIGRGSQWGNPYVIGTDGTRAEVLKKFEDMVMEEPGKPYKINEIKRLLKGKHLVCFCAPQACHGDLLLRIANEE